MADTRRIFTNVERFGHPAWPLLAAILCIGVSRYAAELLPELVKSAAAGPMFGNENFPPSGDGTFAVHSTNTAIKMLSQKIALAKYTDYRVSFEITQISGSGTIVVDFTGDKYDNDEQEFHLLVSPADAPMQVDRVLNSGDAPEYASLRIYSSDAIKFTVRKPLITYHAPPLRLLEEASFLFALLSAALGALQSRGRCGRKLSKFVVRLNQRLTKPGVLLATRRIGQVWPAVLMAGLAVWTVGTMGFIVRRAYVPIPWADAWDTWRLFVVVGERYSAQLMFYEHVDHRITVPRLFFMIDHYLFQARNVFVLVSSFVLQLIHAVLIGRIGVRSGIRGWPAVLISAGVVASMFSAQQFDNFTLAFQIQFICVYLFATLALALLAQASITMQDAHSGTVVNCSWVLLACLAATAATYSMGNGILVWGVLGVLALVLALPRVWVLVLLGCAALVATAYFRGYQPSGVAKPWESTRAFSRFAIFAGTFIGSPVDQIGTDVLKMSGVTSDSDLGALERDRVLLACAMGLVGDLLVIGLWISSFRRRGWNVWQLVLLYNCLFIVATSVVVALGRMSGPRLSEAMTSRYTTPAYVFWSLLLVLLYSRFHRAPDARPFQMMAVNWALCITILLAIAIYQPEKFEFAHKRAPGVMDAEMAIGTGVYDFETWRTIYHTPPDILDAVAYLKSHRLSVFSEKWTN